MAERTIARPSKPNASTASACASKPSASDLLENKQTQLTSLLTCCHGEDGLLAHCSSFDLLSNVLWLAADLSREAGELYQEVAAAAR
ncbi:MULTISPECIES: hypothetical protein [unclassified Variovorax]|jgi:hypothetical protein|uniref:hypothetical protein n=1 Tax=unclassified Variovorax TaxID=663243 RepID=UPI0008CA491D|nr:MULTISPECIES: hypothetical protein [unclassified Variovorax]SEJ43806.1 hypothetical protein SAMN05518853_10239 [Variovorax sp. OK202]SFC42068.1 hypothetical protein SAMN05444746_10239 [Variovorax sp. OK212]